MKKFRPYLYILAVIILSLFGYKYYQKKQMANFKPKIETIQSLNTFVKQNDCISKSVVIVPKSFDSYLALQNYFGVGSAYIFDQNFHVIDNNITSENGSCFADLSKNICEGNFRKNKDFIEKSKGREKLLFDNTIEINNKPLNYDGYDYVIVYSWAKFLPPSYDKQLLSFTNCVDSKKVLIISLNLDILNTWNISNEYKEQLKL